MKIINVDKKTGFAIAAIVLAGAVLLAFILLSGKSTAPDGHEESSSHPHGEAGQARHGGKLFSQGRLSVEVVLAETNGEARHQLWVYNGGKALLPSAISASARIRRPQGQVENYLFAAAKDSLLATTTIAEPHVFEASFVVRAGKDTVQFKLESAEGKIALTDAQIKTAGITVAAAGPARIRSAFQLAGEVRFNEDRTAHVVPRLAGIVESVAANLGQQVKKGQVLAVIASTAVSEMRSELLSAQRRQALAQVTYEREKQLWQDKISAEQDYLQAQQNFQEARIATQNARQKLAAIGISAGTSGALSRYELRAPFDGAIVEKHIALGEAVKEDSNVFMISDLSSVWAEIIVPAKDLGIVRVGEKATVRATSMASVSTGTIAYVGSLLGEQTRTAKARVTLANPDLAWRPGLFVNVELTSDERDAPVAVVADAVQTVGETPTVFIKIDGGFIGQAVEIGRSDGKHTEIVAGLKAGAAYATGGSFVLKAEQGKDSAEHAH